MLAPRVFPSSPATIQITGGEDYFACLNQDGQVFLFGSLYSSSWFTPKTYSYPTLLEGIPKIRSIASGSNHLLLLSDKGDLFGLGDNSYGQLGNKKGTLSLANRLNKSSGNQMISAGSYFSVVKNKADKLLAFGWGIGIKPRLLEDCFQTPEMSQVFENTRERVLPPNQIESIQRKLLSKQIFL